MIRPNTPTHDPVFEPLLAGDLAKRLIDYHPPTETLERVEALRALANEGELAADDRAEYETLIESLDLVAILQAKARATMDQRAL